ncbi:MAG: flagellar motor protein MotA [Rhodospirillales bacterium]
MTRPQKFLLRMILFVAAVGALAATVHRPLLEAFQANAPLNGLILGVLTLGVLYNFRQVFVLYPEVAWIENFRRGQAGGVTDRTDEPRLLASMAAMVSEKRDSLSLSTMAMRSLLDGIAARLDESRDLSRYTTGLLIFLGLLGTFWGLLETVSSIGDVIGGLEYRGGDDAQSLFSELKIGLEAPLSGMGTAFSSSLFGLAGSLVLGFLDLQAGQAQNRFYNDLEEWLSSVTRLSSGAFTGGEGEQTMPAYVEALLEQTAESLEKLQRTLERGESARMALEKHMAQLAIRIGELTDQMRGEQEFLRHMAESQLDLKSALEKLADRGHQNQGVDDATRTHIRNLDALAGRIAADLGHGRDEILETMRNEMKLLARVIAAGAGGPRG